MSGSYYVYHLVDPRDDRVFYVGKGKGNRLKTHVSRVRNGKWDNELKCQAIASILEDGLDVIERMVASELDEAEAFRIEREHIALHRETATNITNGATAGLSYQEKAKRMLSSVKSYEFWVLTAPVDRLEAARRVFGDLRVFHAKFVDSLEMVATRPQPKFIVCRV